MKKIILPTVMIATMMATASLFVQDSDCSRGKVTVTDKKKTSKLTRKQMMKIKKRFGTHSQLLQYFVEALENLSNKGKDPLNIKSRQLLKQLNNEISQILQNPEEIDSDACESLRKIREYISSIKGELKGKKLELANKIIEKLAVLDQYVNEELKEKEELNRENSQTSNDNSVETDSSKENVVSQPLPSRPQVEAGEEEETPPPLPPRSKSAPLKLEEEETPPPLPPRSASAPVPQVPEDYAVAPTPPPSPNVATPSKELKVDDINAVSLKKTEDSAEKSASAMPSSLLEQIRAGKQLKKTEGSAKKSPPTTPVAKEQPNSTSGDLMAQIRAGKRLKKVEKKASSPEESEVASESSSDINSSLSDRISSAMQRRRAALKEDEEEDNFDDEDWL